MIKIKEICGFAPIYVNSKKYEYDVVTVRDFNGRFKIVRHNALRIKGVEDVALLSPKGSVSSVKSENNISRAKSRVFELALCNDWTIFFNIYAGSRKI